MSPESIIIFFFLLLVCTFKTFFKFILLDSITNTKLPWTSFGCTKPTVYFFLRHSSQKKKKKQNEAYDSSCKTPISFIELKLFFNYTFSPCIPAIPKSGNISTQSLTLKFIRIIKLLLVLKANLLTFVLFVLVQMFRGFIRTCYAVMVFFQ